jgi:anti-sigma B factor antagonist
VHDDPRLFSDDPLSVSISEGPGYVVISVAGEIDAGTQCALRDALTSVLARGIRRVVVDLAGVAFLASSGIGVLMGARRVLAAKGGSLVLAAPRGEVAQILSLTGMGEVIPVAASVADAIAGWDSLRRAGAPARGLAAGAGMWQEHSVDPLR